MKIGHKLILGYLLIALLSSVPLYFTLRAFQNIDAVFDRLMSDPVPAIKSLERLKYAGLRVVSSTSEYGFISNETAAEAAETGRNKDKDELTGKDLMKQEEILISDGVSEFNDSLNDYAVLLENENDADESEHLAVVRNTGQALLTTSSQIIELKKKGDFGKRILEKKEEFEKQESDYLQAINSLLTHEYGQLDEERKSVDATILVATNTTLIITISTFLLAVLSGLYFSRLISSRLERLKKATEKSGDGDHEPVAIELKANDEIGDLGRFFNRTIDDLRSSRAELSAAKNFTDQIMDSMADVLLVVKKDGRISRVNRAALALTGYAENELIGQSIDLLCGNGELMPESGFAELRAKDFLFGLERLMQTKHSGVIPVSLSASVIRDQDHRATGFVCVGQDITERQRAREELKTYNEKLQRSNRELQDFAYVASHDLQEPLRKVQAFSDRLKTRYGEQLTGDGLDYLERMRNAAARMQTLIQDLLTFSRVTTKTQPFAPVNLHTIANEVLADLEISIERAGAVIELKDLPVIEADALQMRQLMQNLIGNALKFKHPTLTPIVTIHAESCADGKARQQRFQITVGDNGIGFDEKYLDKIFTVFQRLHGRSEYEGSGIGLAVCRKIVERHGGQITARSKPGEGAAFIITLLAKQTNKEEN